MEEAPSRNPIMAVDFLLLLLLATLWGGSYTFIKLGVAAIPPITLIAARTSIAGLLLLAIMRWRGLRIPGDVATWGRFLLQACLNSVIPWTLIAWGERSLDAGLATILNSTSPIFTFFLTLAVTRHETLGFRKLFGVFAGMAGICLIVGVQALDGLGEQLAAEIATVLATICYAGAAIFSRGFKGLDPMAPAAGSLLCGAAILIPFSVMVDRPWTLAPSTSSTLALLAGFRNLFPADSNARFGRHNGASLSAGAARRRTRRSVSRRNLVFDSLGRPRLRRNRRGRDDHPGAEGCDG
jgi:drug/metabolite transporter (DMT)-like permease